MALNFNQLAMLQKLRSSVQTFRNNHPKFPLFLNAVSADALKEDTIIEINVTSPDGKHYSSNLKLKSYRTSGNVAAAEFITRCCSQ